jgi:hypothetical protein
VIYLDGGATIRSDVSTNSPIDDGTSLNVSAVGDANSLTRFWSYDLPGAPAPDDTSYQPLSYWTGTYSSRTVLGVGIEIGGNAATYENMEASISTISVNDVSYAVNAVPVPAALPAGLALFGLVAAKRKFWKRQQA